MDKENTNDRENRGYQPKSNIGQFGYQPHINKDISNKSDVSPATNTAKPPKGSDAKDA